MLPLPVITRLSLLYTVLANKSDDQYLSSRALGELINQKATTVRKDINHLGGLGNSPHGYQTGLLKDLIKKSFRLERKIGICLIGLNDLCQIITRIIKELKPRFKIEAGFDSNINKVERLSTGFPLFSTVELAPIIRERKIQIAFITAQSINRDKILNRLIEGGIKGIINFSNQYLSVSKEYDELNICISNINLLSQINQLLAKIEVFQTGE